MPKGKNKEPSYFRKHYGNTDIDTMRAWLSQHLTAQAEMVRQCARMNGAKENAPYTGGIADWVLQHGREMPTPQTPIAKFGKLRRGRMGECYKNAFNWAQGSGGKLVYCEGYAFRIIPVHHAWCIDASGNVYDPTWEDQDITAYYGAAFQIEYVRATVLATQIYTSMLDNWKMGYPLLTGEHPASRALVP